MPTEINPQPGDIISFQLVANGVVGDARVDTKVDAPPMNYATARRLDPEINAKHVALYPYFKEAVGNVDDPSIYRYISVIGRNGEMEIIGIPWISASTYQVVDGNIATIAIDNWREDWRAPFRTFMAGLGANFTINVQSK